MIQLPELKRAENQRSVLELACEPVERVGIAFIGLGKRGIEAFNHYLYIDGVEITAICDIVPERISIIQEELKKHNRPKAQEYFGGEDWKRICESQDIHLIYICTHWSLHTAIATYAMKCGKHVAVEVPAAQTIDECWQLVDTAEQKQRHCFMLENCCYDYFELAVLNMVNHGVLGEIIHCEGAYIHDLRSLDLKLKPDYLKFWTIKGNPYPTHGLGPLCQLLNIHRGDKLELLISFSGSQYGYPKNLDRTIDSASYAGNINNTFIRTRKGKTIILQHDITSPRPYTRNYLVSGTKGLAQKRPSPEISIEPEASEFLSREKLESLIRKYEHPFYKEAGELARKIGAHGGMDFIMDYRLIQCLRKGLPLDMDVYDAAEWSSIIELSGKSVQGGFVPVQVPDFTRGEWNKLQGLKFAK